MKKDVRRFVRGLRGSKRGRLFGAAIFLFAIASFAALTCYFAARSRSQQEDALRQALTVSSQLELIANLHIDANADFLTGVGSARFRSLAWPVSRAVEAMRSYDLLQRFLGDDEASLYQLSTLRSDTSLWASQLDLAATSARGPGASRTVDSAQLEKANKTLQSIMHGLSELQLAQRSKLATMQLTAEAQLVRQKVTFAVALATGLILLAYALVIAHRASLSSSAAKIVAREAHDRFIEYFEQHPLAMLIFDIHTGRVLTANAAAQRQYGGNLSELMQITADELRPPEDRQQFRRDLEMYVASGAPAGSGGVRRHTRLDGQIIHVDVSYHLLNYAGHEACFVTAADVSAHEMARQELRIRSRALDASDNAVVLLQTTAEDAVQVIYANPAFQRLTGLPVADVLGEEAADVLPGSMDDAALLYTTSSTADRLKAATVVEGRRRDGSRFWAQRQISPVLDEHGKTTHTVAVFSDITDRIRDQERLQLQASLDPLTGLLNRSALYMRLADMLGTASTSTAQIAVLFIDLDNFKEINDSLGHVCGDEVIKEVARRLSRSVGEYDVVARFAGDEFVALLVGRSRVDELIGRAKALHASVNANLRVGGECVASNASAGVAVFPDHAIDASTLIRYADAAMYHAKRSRQSALVVYDESIATADAERVELAKHLGRAVQTGALRLVFQPRVAMGTGQPVAFEALLRWFDGERGLISPAVFIPLAEEKGLIVPIGEWVFEQACLQAKDWARDYPDIVVSINVSAMQFLHSDFASTVERTLVKIGVSPRNIELEVTESVLMTPAALVALNAIRRMGVSIAIDDFGTGFSSLNYIREFKPDCIKLDLSFVQGIGKSTIDEVIVKAVLAMAHTLGMSVVAEGVETIEQFAFLADNECDEVQGFLTGRPMPAAQARQALSRSGNEAVEAFA
ncbi:bifunctional diguanylate cyclase/phosphodiesterase [Caballeronia sp. M1242]|uniref:putative bifunctional diguanylate cyclase/phosphodiesterase n=1 Tax=Caballeronia sp. M1242 TaxID=2814653 RepID=UPI0019D16358|nr:bifunctional diguanylate cyclase/phosphodiesterase [Caballeronia sp. M1242]QSN64812.1 EAL domain-containing protein [Caballeronia sp. M1242]